MSFAVKLVFVGYRTVGHGFHLNPLAVTVTVMPVFATVNVWIGIG